MNKLYDIPVKTFVDGIAAHHFVSHMVSLPRKWFAFVKEQDGLVRVVLRGPKPHASHDTMMRVAAYTRGYEAGSGKLG